MLGYKFFIKTLQPNSPSPHKQIPLYNNRFIKKMQKEPRNPFKIDQFYIDVAASAQNHFEIIITDLIKKFYRENRISRICLAGGCALNVIANKKIREIGFLDQVYIQPASNDSGIALAAYMMSSELGYRINPLENVYYGPKYNNEHIHRVLKRNQINFKEVEDPCFEAAKLVANDKIIGWFQGRLEFGPRALGNRSILANPANKDMKNIVNKKIKFRESFRPFCPSVLEEDANLYFNGNIKEAPTWPLPLMLGKHKTKIPSVTHIDGTSRIQTVNKEQNPMFHSYLYHLKELTGIGMTLNTSFNVKGQAIVNTPENALETFYGSGLDNLIIGNFQINK